AFGRDWMSLNKISIARKRTAKILRPWAVSGGIDDYVADVARAQFLRLRRKADKRIDLAVGKQLHRALGRIYDPMNLLGGIEAHISRHAADEQMRARTQVLYAYRPALQIADAADAAMR